MVSKNTKAKKRAESSNEADLNGAENENVETSPVEKSGAESPVASSSAAKPTPTSSRPASPPSESVTPEEPDADEIKEKGNVAFKQGRYGEAIDLYTKAIGLRPTEAAYFTNRAACYMSLKRFKLALEDCRHATTLPPHPTPVKTLLRLARCYAALGSSEPALSTISNILAQDAGNAQAVQLRGKVNELAGHLRNFETAKAKKDWGMARLALDRCLSGVEAEGSEVPGQWRLWRIELELARGKWDEANIAAKYFQFACIASALQHVTSALRFDPSFSPAQQLRKRVKEVEKLKDEGNAAFKLGKLQEAINKYSEGLERVGDKDEEGKGGQIRATFLSNRATTLLKLSKHEDALADTEASLSLFPFSFKALRTRARIHLHLEHYDSAIADFNSAIEQAMNEGNDADVRALRGELKQAEVALKRSKTKDYYKILGLHRECTEVEIKKAYRKESLKHHPDKGGDEEKFKLVVEANAVLSDPQRRQRYDMGEDEDGMSDSSGFGGGMNGMSQMDIAELFAQFHGGGGGGGGGGFSSFGGGGRRGGGFPF